MKYAVAAACTDRNLETSIYWICLWWWRLCATSKQCLVPTYFQQDLNQNQNFYTTFFCVHLVKQSFRLLLFFRQFLRQIKTLVGETHIDSIKYFRLISNSKQTTWKNVYKKEKNAFFFVDKQIIPLHMVVVK